MLTIAILSWNAHRTLKNTLESYRTFGLDKLATEKIIFFQEISPLDIQIANKYGYHHIGSKTNIGIAQAYKRLIEKSTQPFFLFLENDWLLLDKPDNQISDGISFLDHNAADVIRYRSRRFPGEPLWTYQFKGSEYERPTHLLDSVHWTEHPDESFLEITRYENWYFASSRNANWTNNPTMFRRDFLIDVILPNIGTRDVEVDLQPWWEQQDFVVAQSDGLFTHRRIG